MRNEDSRTQKTQMEIVIRKSAKNGLDAMNIQMDVGNACNDSFASSAATASDGHGP